MISNGTFQAAQQNHQTHKFPVLLKGEEDDRLFSKVSTKSEILQKAEKN